ncbi:MAG: polysaccharide deacetylase family protein [Rhodospirillaceae bacterium]|jgi:allantoinase|nr:polysaccharide deacetylase family protein [Rhodospirillaceae bacterium]
MSNPRIPYQMASERPKLSPPDGKPLMVHLVVNVENWLFDNAMPRKILTAPHGLEQIPDIPNYSWAEYGMRCGMPRLLDCFAERGLPASVSLNAGVIETYPTVAAAMRDAGWEFIGHGVHQKSIQGEADEAALIAQSLSMIEAFTGQRPDGWLGPGLKETMDTPDILKAQGVEYVFDWVLDDLPCWMTTLHGPLLSMPYTLEINDSVIYAVEKHASPEMRRRLVDTLEIFDRETKTQPRVLTLGLHPHLIGVPHRMVYLEKMLDLLQDRGDTVFMTGRSIADWFESACPAPKE